MKIPNPYDLETLRRLTTKERLAHPNYNIWRAMRQRCENKNKHNYPQYGGRGIKVCDRWRTFEQFVIDVGVRPFNMSLDRIDNDGNYEPNNVRWATPTMQAANRKSGLKTDSYEGKKFGNLTILKLMPITGKRKPRRAIYQCDCGRSFNAEVTKIVRELVSCPCKKEKEVRH